MAQYINLDPKVLNALCTVNPRLIKLAKALGSCTFIVL